MRLRSLVAILAVLVVSGFAYALPSGCNGASSRRETSSPVPAGGGLVVFVGASASDGHGLGGEICLARTFKESLSVSAYASKNCATGKFMGLTMDERAAIVDKALEEEPDLVVAVDFLFWFAHCLAVSDDGRLKKLEDGLRMLDRFECPVVVGDIPDVRGVEKKFPLLRLLLPATETLIKMNERVREWVSTRNQTRATLLVPLAEAVAAQMAGVPLRIGDREHPTAGLLQEDGLHPTLEGHRILCLLVQQTLIGGKLFRREDFK